MTVREWLEAHDVTTYHAKWAADTVGGFGKRGWSAYGDVSRCDVIRVEWGENEHPTLWVWHKSFGELPREEAV